MKPFVAPLSNALGHLQQATTWLMQNAMAKPDNAGAAATDYLQLFGFVTLGYMWARMAKVALDKIAAVGRDGLSEDQARDRPLLHGADAAGNGAASRAHPDRLRHHHGIGGGSVLTGVCFLRRRDPLSYDEHHL